jgi:hypothetical protein
MQLAMKILHKIHQIDRNRKLWLGLARLADYRANALGIVIGDGLFILAATTCSMLYLFFV